MPPRTKIANLARQARQIDQLAEALDWLLPDDGEVPRTGRTTACNGQ
jgi:hypothetical protein